MGISGAAGTLYGVQIGAGSSESVVPPFRSPVGNASRSSLSLSGICHAENIVEARPCGFTLGVSRLKQIREMIVLRDNDGGHADYFLDYHSV